MYLSSFFSTALAVVAIAGSTVSAAPFPSLPGSITMVRIKPNLQIRYETSEAHDDNWIGIYYPSYGGPEKEKYVNDAIEWKPAKGENGVVELDIEKLQPGRYTVYFLSQGGYKWQSIPIDVVITGSGPLKFIINNFTTHNARVGDYFDAVIAGLLGNPEDQDTNFVKKEGPDWVQVTTDGSLFGTPTAGGLSRVAVEAQAKSGARALLIVYIPVHNAGASLVEQLSVVTLNLWYGGREVKDAHRKQIQYIANSGADVVGLQETMDTHGIRLANALGWHVWQGKSAAIIARYPIAQVYQATGVSGAVRLELDGNKREVIVWNAHLADKPYGPYSLCFDRLAPVEVLRHEEESGREAQMRDILYKMRPHLGNAKKVPVILTGDFNAPSHLDYTDATRWRHCNAGRMEWPTSVQAAKAGLADSFREIHSDPLQVPGNTWSPIYRSNDGRHEPEDRIDFIHHKGLLRPIVAEVDVWGTHRFEPHHADNEWPSDHAAVRTIFSFP
ncbi:hypothetical protein JDV02_009602 [Purpureocillium takamizusanense]|uniref:Endonuclease/exonuclease/phosphatase domain-containing protein n=1 Tax=Purpureocillium takamizusanense TaxID=2060973 RepID=A0A9Q8QQA6_9HYPO|nr:uncharacterized protein JDV02_009602 [Purpureocillium takamizusanense]UNI23805.1 hypothetical protein JDV02_009602 [Purpureocillium takamizusanense]